MPKRIDLSWEDCQKRAHFVWTSLKQKYSQDNDELHCWPVPNGGIPAALILSQVSALGSLPVRLANQPHEADIIVDDIIDSGKTRDRYTSMLSRPFYALVDKQKQESYREKWISFPWERMQKQEGPEDNVLRLLQYIGEDPARPGLLETPKRVVKSYEELFMGYHNDPKQYVKIFEEQASDCMVILETEFYSHCEHHMAPFFGKAHLAYIPSKAIEYESKYDEPSQDHITVVKADRGFKVLGASKLARIFDCFARRLQIQERLGSQFTEFLMKSDLKPLGAACQIEATHFCMCSRGVSKQHSKMITTSIEGVFTDATVRNEFLSLTRS